MQRGSSSSDRPWIETVWNSVTANFGLKVVSFLIAIIFWMIVLGSHKEEINKEIPIEIITSPDVAYVGDAPNRVLCRLSGPKTFLRTIMDRREEPIRINLSGVKLGVQSYRFSPDAVRMPLGIKIVSFTPPGVNVRLEPVKSREVALKLALQGGVSEGYHIVKKQIKPETIHVKGAESAINDIPRTIEVPVDVSSLKKKLERDLKPDLERFHVQLEGEVPHLLIDVEPASANFRIKNVAIRVISSYRVALEEKTVTVLVRAEMPDMQELDRSHVYATVDLSDKTKGKYTSPVKVTLPEQVGLVKVIPDKVTVTLY